MDVSYFRALLDARESAQTLVRELLLNIERAYLRGQTPPGEWYVRQLSEIESALTVDEHAG